MKSEKCKGEVKNPLHIKLYTLHRFSEMYLYIGKNTIIDTENIVMLINLRKIQLEKNPLISLKVKKKIKSAILLRDGTYCLSEIGASTLEKRFTPTPIEKFFL